MDFERLIRDLESLPLNLYNFALYTPDGVLCHQFQPCSICQDGYSVAKLFIVTALGLLWDDGKIRMTDPISRYLPIPEGADPKWHSATIEHAVTHTLGFDEGFLDIDCEDASLFPQEDYLEMVFAHPLPHAPGTHEQYTDAAYYLLSRLISAAAGENADTLLNRRIIRPLRFREIAWSRCPLEYPIGATGLYAAAQDVVKLAALYLQEGEWQGRRLLSREWVHLAIERGYELHQVGESSLIGKGGMYGQMAAFSREGQFAAAWHAHHNKEQGECLREYLNSRFPAAAHPLV